MNSRSLHSAAHGAATDEPVSSKLASARADEDAQQAPTVRRSRRRPGENRERLIAAGISEFALHGFRGTSTTSIALRAEVPQPHVYTNFRTKHELFAACVAYVVDVLRSSGALNITDIERRLYAQLVLQSVAAMGESSVQGELRALLITLEDALGRHDYEQLVLLGAHGLTRRL